jgi:hypothetical protein
MKKIVSEWRDHAIEAERSRIDALSDSINQFIKFRTELVRLAREVSTAKAREFGDNDVNRSNRSRLNRQLAELLDAYLQHQQRAKEQVDDSQWLNFVSLLALAVAALVISAIGLLVVNQTVIMLFN